MILEALCEIIGLQYKIIKAQAEALAQLDAEVMADEIAEAGRKRSELFDS